MLLNEVRSRFMNRQKLEEFGNIKMLKEREVVIGRRPWKGLHIKTVGAVEREGGLKIPSHHCVRLI